MSCIRWCGEKEEMFLEEVVSGYRGSIEINEVDLAWLDCCVLCVVCCVLCAVFYVL